LIGTFIPELFQTKLLTVFAATGVIPSAVDLLWMLQRVLSGEITKKDNAELEEMNWREKTALIPLVIMAIVMGVGPRSSSR
jgi:NADH-quinone oxidoreductase subunit M